MAKYYEEWDGKKFPVRTVVFPIQDGFDTPINVADLSLWDAIEYAYEHEWHPKRKDAIGLDNDIYYYCDYGFIASDPTDEEIVEYLIKNGC